MTASIPGVYRNGAVELSELPAGVAENTPVIVTFQTKGSIRLDARGITPDQAVELRARLSAFADDWNSPEMSAYDDYDRAKR